MKTLSDKQGQQLLKVLNCLIDTAERTTALEKVYDDVTNHSVTWAEVGQSHKELTEALK